MYSLISALGKDRKNGEKWHDVSIGDMPLNDIFATYEKVYVTLSNVFLPNNVTLKIESIRNMVAGQTITFNQFLVSNGNRALPTENKVYTLNTRYVKYADAFHAGYAIEPIHPTYSGDMPVPELDKTNLKLTRHGTDYALFYKSCLVNVNGFYHLTDADHNGAYVIDGMKSRNKSKKNQIGITSFRELGELSFIPIRESMIYKNDDNESLGKKTHLDIGVDLADKTVMLVLGGYLHVLDEERFYRTGTTTFAIDFANIPLIQRYYESNPFLDLSSLGLDYTVQNPRQISVSELYGDEAIKAYLTLSQSFLIILNNADIFVDKEHIHNSTLPGMYISHVKPYWPMTIGAGRHVNYWYTAEDGQWAINCEDSAAFKPIYETMDWKTERSVSDQQEAVRTHENSPAWFVKIGVDI